MSAFSRNVAANLAGTGWSALVQLAVVPMLVARLGVESYALVGFYAALLAILGILDLGLAPTLTRKMAGIVAQPSSGRAADVLRTFEAVYLSVAATAGLLLALGAPMIARHWLSSVHLDVGEVEGAVRLMGLLFALRWASAPYTAALQGLQRQVSASGANAAMVTVANVGGLLALEAVGASIGVFMLWQCLSAVMQLAWLRWLAVRATPAQAGPARVDRAVLVEGWKFSAGVAGISLMGIVLAQSDKLILSKLVALDEYGYYSIAQVLVAGLQVIVLPVFNAAMPRLTELSQRGDEDGLRRFFRSSSQLLNALLVPSALFLILFSNEVMALWLGAGDTAQRAAPLFRLLVAGVLLNGLMSIPYALQLARGNTRLALSICAGLCVLIVPAIVILTTVFGLVGGAATGILVNGVYLAVGLPLTYRACLGSPGWMQFHADILRYQGFSVLLIVLAWAGIPSGLPGILLLAILALTFALALAVSLAFTPGARQTLMEVRATAGAAGRSHAG